jgi:membrane protein
VHAGGLARVRGQLERSLLGRCLGTFVEIGGIDRATTLAAQAFTALIPLLLLLTSVLPTGGRNVAGDAIVDRFDLSGGSAQAVQALFARSGEASIGALSVVLLLFSGVSLTRRLQNLYLQAWRLTPPARVRRSMNAAFALAALILELALLYFARRLIGALPIPAVLSWVLAALVNLVLWTSVPWLLLDRRISWRRLLPTGLIAGIAVAVYGIASTIYMPALIESYSRRYGIFGVTLALVGWLLAISLILVVATVLGAEFERAPEPWARRLRARFRLGPEDLEAQPETAAAADSVSGTSEAGPRTDQTSRAV